MSLSEPKNETVSEADQQTGVSNRTRIAPSKKLLDITTLIRSIQRSEGNIDCFQTGRVECPEKDCIWRVHCLPSREY